MEKDKDIFGEDLVPLSTYHDIKNVTGVEVDDRRQKLTNCIHALDKELLSYVNFCRALPGFKELDSDDKITLIRGMILKSLLICDARSHVPKMKY